MPVELDPATYGLTIWDLEREFLTGGVGGVEKQALGDLLGVLRDAYCRTIGIEYMHIQDTDEQRWIQGKVEGVHITFTKDEKRRILDRLNAAEAFEKFLATKYVGAKRFGLEGAESAIPILDSVLTGAVEAGLDSAVLGMAHRGRLNVLARSAYGVPDVVDAFGVADACDRQHPQRSLLLVAVWQARWEIDAAAEDDRWPVHA